MNNLPNLSWVVDQWASPVELIKIETKKVDFKVTRTHVAVSILGLIQPARLNQVKVEFVDITRVYMTLHTTSELPLIGDYFKHRNNTFKIISFGPYDDFGYRELIGESVNEGELT